MGGKSSGGIIGYKYLMGLHMGICRGPVDEIPAIEVGGRLAWPIGVGESTPTDPVTASMPSNTPVDLFVGGPAPTPPSILIVPVTDYEGVPHTLMGYIILSVVGGFSSQFTEGKLLTIAGSGRHADVTYYPEIGSPYTQNEYKSVDGAYQIQSCIDGVVTIFVGNVDKWYVLTAGTSPVYDSPTMSFSVPIGDPDVGDTASGYPADVSKQIYINAPTLFGGNKGEGGIKGTCDVMMGEPTQPVNLALKEMLGAATLSAFRGVLTLFYDGLIASLNPYPKPWRFRIRRILKGWADDNVFYAAKCRIDITVDGKLIRAMNGAHIIYQCLTDPDWGRGMDPALIDTAAFEAAADTLYDEGFGLCMKWVRQDTVEEFIQQVIDHIGAALYVSRTTALVTLKLIRADYDVETIPSFDRTNGVVTVIEDQNTSHAPTVNEIIVKFVDPRTGEDGEVRAQNIALIQAYGSVVSDTLQYPGIPTAALAGRIAMRDLRIKGLPLRRMKLQFNRAAYNVEPGGVFKFSDPSRGIGNIVLRVGLVEDGLNMGSDINVTCVEDVFGLNSSSYIGVPDVVGPPVGGVLPAAYERVFEASYYDMRLLLPAAGIMANVGYVVAAAARATELHQDFTLYTDENPDELEERGGSPFRAAGVLSENVLFSDLLIVVEGMFESDLVTIGMSAMIGDEIVRVDSFNSLTNEVWISRGCADTIPANHLAGEVVLFYNRIGAVDPTAYGEGDVVYGKVITRTSAAELNPTLATAHEVTIIGRPGRPYPPGNVRVNDVQYGFPMVFPPLLEVTWAHRNKVVQAENLVSHLEAGLTPPEGLTYTIEIIDPSDDSVVRTTTGITDDSWEYNLAMWLEDGALEEIVLKLISVQDGEESWQPYMMPITIDAAGWGEKWGMSWGSTL